MGQTIGWNEFDWYLAQAWSMQAIAPVKNSKYFWLTKTISWNVYHSEMRTTYSLTKHLNISVPVAFAKGKLQRCVELFGCFKALRLPLPLFFATGCIWKRATRSADEGRLAEQLCCNTGFEIRAILKCFPRPNNLNHDVDFIYCSQPYDIFLAFPVDTFLKVDLPISSIFNHCFSSLLL